MNKIYKEGNYIIIETARETFEYPCTMTYSFYDGTYYRIKNTIGGYFRIDASEVNRSLWFEKDGTTAYTAQTLVTFLRNNTAI